MVEVNRPARVDSAPTPNNVATTKRRMPVKRAMDRAFELYNAGTLELAERLCAQIVTGRPRMAAAHNLMGAILNARGKQKEAVKAFQRAATIDPRMRTISIKSRRNRAPARQASRSIGCARRKPLASIRSRHRPTTISGSSISNAANIERAVECYEKAIALKKHFPEAHNNLGNALRALGRQEEALDHYQKALIYRENYPEVYNNMASILRDQDQIVEAEHSYRKAIELRPKYLEAYSNLAGLLAENDQPIEALRILGDALRIEFQICTGVGANCPHSTPAFKRAAGRAGLPTGPEV